MMSGIEIEEIEVGTGTAVTRGCTVRIRYDGFLNRGEAFQNDVECTVNLSRRESIAGLRYGIEGMRMGGRRKIHVSPHLAYGENGVPGIIPSNAALIFDVRLLEVVSCKSKPA